MTYKVKRGAETIAALQKNPEAAGQFADAIRKGIARAKAAAAAKGDEKPERSLSGLAHLAKRLKSKP